MKTFRLLQQSTTNAQTTRESLIQIEKGKAINQRKAIFCGGPGGGRAQLDYSFARQEAQSQQKLREQAQKSKIEEKSKEKGYRLTRFREKQTAIGAERQVMMGTMPLWTNENSKHIHKNISYLIQPRGNLFQYHLFLQKEIRQNKIIQVIPIYVKLFTPTFYIPKRDGSYRKILDARAINKQAKKFHFKLIYPFYVQQVLLKNSYLISFDNKSTFN
ncbi:MAG: hypothetical protein EZS28_009076 [Streblomastix strix]|uniref:Uncharacterized protein n=1 Tax=Streblomastix strix TaxID=222440 RepID=A0A5J4WKF8_9EUKA|nr:MAG: hypothetical protein EZS28_009076 [Streblomastix strix]